MAPKRCARSISPISPVSPVIHPISPITDISSISLGDGENTRFEDLYNSQDNGCDDPKFATPNSMTDTASSDPYTGVRPGLADLPRGLGLSTANKKRNLDKITRIKTNIDKIERMQEASYDKSHAEWCNLEGKKGLQKQKLQDITNQSSRIASARKEKIDKLESS
ncbi:MAG: hypothetical protein Q9180_005844 [Flavoplaca navasiana]